MTEFVYKQIKYQIYTKKRKMETINNNFYAKKRVYMYLHA